MNAVPGARTQTTLPLSPPQSNMAPPSEDNGKVKKDITRLPWRCAHHIRVIYTVNGMLLCLGYGCSSASPPLSGVTLYIGDVFVLNTILGKQLHFIKK